jgi:hypothetical protein
VFIPGNRIVKGPIHQTQGVVIIPVSRNHQKSQDVVDKFGDMLDGVHGKIK